MIIYYSPYNTNISYEIPDTVEEIGVGAFFANKYLEEIIIPDGVRKIGVYAFSDCMALKSVSIPDSVTEFGENIEGIMNGTFAHCYSLESVHIGTGVEIIGGDSFWGCNRLACVTGMENVEIIENGAFSGCDSLETINLPEKLMFIGDRAFEYCTNLISINIPDSVEEIGEEAFRGCSSAVDVVIGDSVKVIHHGAFADCTGIQSITLPHTLPEFFGDAFYVEYPTDNRIFIYYNGTPAEWRAIENKPVFPRIKGMRYFAWVSIYDNEGNFLYKVKSDIDRRFEAYNIPVDEEGDFLTTYVDQNLSERYDYSQYITGNMNLYIEKFNGTKTLVSDVGEEVGQQVMFVIKGMHMKEGSRVILALYNDGKYVGVQDAIYYQGDIIFKTDIPHTTAKVMVWGNNGMRPLHTAEKVNTNNGNGN